MSYPEPRYLGDGGEASATYRPNGAPADITYASGGTADYLATGASTGGLFGLYRWNMSGEPSGPGPHFHRTMAESFYVLLGTVKIYDGREWVDCTPATSCTCRRAGSMRSATSPASPPRCCCTSRRARPARATSRAWPASRPRAARAPRSSARFYAEHDNFWL